MHKDGWIKKVVAQVGFELGSDSLGENENVNGQPLKDQSWPLKEALARLLVGSSVKTGGGAWIALGKASPVGCVMVAGLRAGWGAAGT